MKNLLLLMFTLLATSGLIAQLHVSPNGSTDSFIYVNDQIIFVEDNIDLVRNTNNPATEANIYLRNDGQLIQGNTNGVNSGSGRLSVYQDSNSDAFDYNFWCAPVGVAGDGVSPPSVPAMGNTRFGIRQFSDVVSVTESTPSTWSNAFNGTSSPLLISQRWIYTYDTTNQEYSYIGNSTQVPSGRGFTMKGTDVTAAGVPETQNQLYDFRGRPNNGDFILPLQHGVFFTNGNGITDLGVPPYNFTFTGNPYPSALDLRAIFFEPGNEEIENISFWDEDRTINSHFYTDNEGGYGTWVPTMTDGPGLYIPPTFMTFNNDGTVAVDVFGNPITTTTATSVQRRFSPIGQGFMIRAFDDFDIAPINGDGMMVIRNSHRRFVREGAANNSEFRSNENLIFNEGNQNQITSANTTTSYTSSEGIPPLLRIETFFGDNTHHRQLALMFHQKATMDFDRGGDATHRLDGAISETYFPIKDEKLQKKLNLVIQSVPYYEGLRVPISFATEIQNKFAVTIAENTAQELFKEVFLWDRLENSYTQINDEHRAEFILDQGIYDDRYFIVFKKGQNNKDFASSDNRTAESTSALNVDFVQNNPLKQLEVSNPDGYDIKQLNVFDITGKLAISQSNLGTSNRLSFPTANLADGSYIVRLATSDDQIINYKIIVANK